MNATTLLRPLYAYLPHALVLVVLMLSGMNPSVATANILLAEPVHGSFTTEPQTVASGRVEMVDLSAVVLTINGTVVPLAADGSFSHPVTLDAQRIFNPVLVELTSAGNTIALRRPVVIVGPSLPATALAPESLAVRLTDRGLDQLELLVARSVELDVTQFLPPGPLFTEEFCVEIPVLPDICTDVEVSIDDDPAPRLGSVEMNLDAVPDQVNLELTLRNLFVRAEVDTAAASCGVTVTADSLLVNGAFRLEPNAANPSAVDVMQVGNMTLTFGNFNEDTDCGGILGDFIELLIDLLVGNIRERLQDGLEEFLNTVDAAGNTPLADLLEDLLGMLSVETALNAAIAESGLQARVPFDRITEDNDGITFVMDTGVEALSAGSCTAPQDDLDLDAVYHVPQPLPVLGSTTPGGLPFDAGGVFSATLLNQILRAATACGLLQAEFTELDVDGTPTPVTAGLLAMFLPAFEQLDPAQPVRMVVRPTLAPLVSGTRGPAGELVDLRVAAYLIELFIPGDPAHLMQLALDLQAGADALVDPAIGAVQPRIGDIADWASTLLINPLGVDPALIDFFLEELIFPEVENLNADLEPFEIPSVEGLDVTIVEISPIDAYLGAFVDLMVQP